MDIYQSNLLNRGTFSFVSELGKEKIVVNDTITLYQNENYKISNYKIILSNSFVSAVLYNGKEYTLSKDGKFIIDIDLSNAGNVLTIVFKNGVADDCTLPLSVVFADTEAFDKKMYEEKQATRKENMHFTCRTGLNLVNLHWQNACDEVAASEIQFYADDSKKKLLIEKIELPNDRFFYSITSLAYGSYSAIITQKDASGNTIITDNANIQINDPFVDLCNQLSRVKSQVAASGRHTVVI